MTFAAVTANATALLMSCVFLLAAASKLNRDNQTYYEQALGNYGLGGRASVLALGGAELLAGVLLLFAVPVSRELGAVLGAVLLVGYLVGMCRALWQGKKDIDCGCHGPSKPMTVGPALLLRNVIYVALLAYCALGGGMHVGHLENWWLALPCALALIMLVSSTEQVLINAQKSRQLKAAMA